MCLKGGGFINLRKTDQGEKEKPDRVTEGGLNIELNLETTLGFFWLFLFFKKQIDRGVVWRV